MTRQTCPSCSAEIDARGAHRDTRPFCSQACRVADLERWLDGKYVIAGEPVDIADLDTTEAPER